ncbi:MAG TPA: hypothetical protein VLI92_04715 [Candidatus Saccharimonadales bacterium]|nr:hypothetical protein [Candidatus Saccharimonadales bacterium]
MFNLLINLYNKLEQIKGRKLVILLLVIFIIFLAFGLSFGYITQILLNKTEQTKFVSTSTGQQIVARSFDGLVTYVNPNQYPADNVTYALVDANGKVVILLRSRDQKLVVSEGHNVRVKGIVEKSADGTKDILNVDEVIIKNGAN